MQQESKEESTEGQRLAELVVGAMMDRDAASNHLGMRIIQAAAGQATVTMKVKPEMLNGHLTCHGGFIFSLADSAFAFACNSRNEATVAAGCSIDYLRPAIAGQTLTAVAQERALPGRTGVYDVTVSNEEGQLVALFRGRSHRIKGGVIPLESGSITN
ncbi:hydroxyphenylacetyl-CoA thioesterase PaaI [Hydrocarboniphaga effusa]|jgi:acyl-CoA thioesterase|uniref:Phenylacetic acid degradation protein n=1 Tax=Hydrocarboniphaga effusa AP103 TaxID=1172194 RepID=I7ZIP2_9GAMM|nr:hydroxyphenylacetyl-CoA thioesterase PaaI [Hydrocarboniphaga effusa]EIT71612.1 phenylacetic acid degradation protein [Hydrocarboniphaga effusa AP103]